MPAGMPRGGVKIKQRDGNMIKNSTSETHLVEYLFSLSDGKQVRFVLQFESKTMRLVAAPEFDIQETVGLSSEERSTDKNKEGRSSDKEERSSQPQSTPSNWAALENNKCRHCPLDSATHPLCPIAQNMAPLMQPFSERLSYERVKVQVRDPRRQYFKETDLQDGLQSIFGLIMATSDCPHMSFLRPLAKFHLPFATLEETVVRMVSIYLLRLHVREAMGETVEFGLSELEALYEKVNIVNEGIVMRLRALQMRDSSHNGIMILASLATLLPWELSGDLSKLASYVLLDP